MSNKNLVVRTKKPKYRLTRIMGVDTATRNMGVFMLDLKTMKAKLYLHDLKHNWNKMAENKETLPDVLSKEIVERHEKHIKRCRFVAFERNKPGVIPEVKYVAMILPGVIKGKSAQTSVGWLSKGEIQSYFKIPRGETYGDTKWLARMSKIYTKAQIKQMESTFPKIDDIMDATNVCLANLVKNHVAPMMNESNWKRISVRDALRYLKSLQN